MLIITRRVGQIVTFNKDIKVMVTSVKGSQVKLGIECPEETEIERPGEVYTKGVANNRKTTSGIFI